MKHTAVKKDNRDERYDPDTHYGFGENWADYAQNIREQDIKQAEDGVLKLVPAGDLAGKRWLDIGCGSGLHSLAALRAGVSQAVCIDFDVNSVQTTQAVLDAYGKAGPYTVFQQNILLDTDHPALKGQVFDVVYSWGVLHHTGAMWDAIARAAAFVKPGGLFVIALYKETPLCGFWKIEKKFYTSLPKWARWPFDYLYAAAFFSAKLLLGQNPVQYIRTYQEKRGMRFMTDVRDWMGGYPYESVAPETAQEKIETMGFVLERSYNTSSAKASGLFGSGCAEYVFRKR